MRSAVITRSKHDAKQLPGKRKRMRGGGRKLWRGVGVGGEDGAEGAAVGMGCKGQGVVLEPAGEGVRVGRRRLLEEGREEVEEEGRPDLPLPNEIMRRAMIEMC
jgi:hypothetical protein